MSNRKRILLLLRIDRLSQATGRNLLTVDGGRGVGPDLVYIHLSDQNGIGCNSDCDGFRGGVGSLLVLGRIRRTFLPF